jgi:hypothetical protein
MMDVRHAMHPGRRALGTVIGSAGLGAAYVAFITAVAFPPDIVRVVPLLWFGAAGVAWFLVRQAIRADARPLLGIVSGVLNIPNTLLAALFSLGALMGD